MKHKNNPIYFIYINIPITIQYKTFQNDTRPTK